MAKIRCGLRYLERIYKINASKSSVRFSHNLHLTRNALRASSFLIPPCEKFFNPSPTLFRTPKRFHASETSSRLIFPGSESSSKGASSSSSGGDGGDESSKKKAKTDDFRMKTMKYTFIAFGAVFTTMVGVVIYEWGSPACDENGNPIEDEFSHMPSWKAYLLRSYKEVIDYNQMIKEPSREKLLPEPLTDPYYQPPYTLVLEMTDVLVHPDWTYKTGWRFKKRPGVDYFLQQVGPPIFEVVIFTAEQGFTAYPILDSLDPNGYIMYRLFRDSTRYMDGHHVKDLSCLNRDLSKVIYVDWNPKSFSLQPRNALMVEKWTGSDDDKSLYDLADMLRTIGTSEVQDVRTVLEYYSQFDDKSPIDAFKENKKKLREEEEKRMKESQGSTLVGGLLKGLQSR